MTVAEAITFWERRHYRLGKVSAVAFDLTVNPKKRLKALSILARWATPHLRMFQKLASATRPIPKLTSTVIPTGVAIVGEGGKEIILVDDPGYAGKEASNKWFDTTLAKRLNK